MFCLIFAFSVIFSDHEYFAVQSIVYLLVAMIYFHKEYR